MFKSPSYILNTPLLGLGRLLAQPSAQAPTKKTALIPEHSSPPANHATISPSLRPKPNLDLVFIFGA